MLTEFEPRVEEMEVGLKSCDDQVTEWEAQAEEIKAMNSANIENLRQQASDIQVLLHTLHIIPKELSSVRCEGNVRYGLHQFLIVCYYGSYAAIHVIGMLF